MHAVTVISFLLNVLGSASDPRLHRGDCSCESLDRAHRCEIQRIAMIVDGVPYASTYAFVTDYTSGEPSASKVRVTCVGDFAE